MENHNKKLNILMATDSFFPDGFGGKHTYVYELAKELVCQGHGVYIITIKLRKSDLVEENIEGINVFRYNAILCGLIGFILRPLSSIINSGRLFRRLAKEKNFDLLNLHSLIEAAGIFSSKKSKGIPRIFTFHSSVFQEVSIQSKKKRYGLFLNAAIFYFIRLLEKFCLNSSNSIIVLSKFNKEQLFKLYSIENSKINIIPGGVDVNQFKPPSDAYQIRGKLGLPQDKIIILTVRRLVVRMGVEVLIEAMKIIVKREKNILLVIGGDGFLRSELEKSIERLRLESHVKLLGIITNEQLLQYYQAADLFVLPTQELEGFGLVTLEALACGLPVLGTPVGGTIEILESFDRTMLFKDKTVCSIAEGIENFVKSQTIRKQLKEKCRNYAVSNYSWKKIAFDNEKLFFAVLKSEKSIP